MNKKLLAILLAGTFVFAGCNGETNKDSKEEVKVEEKAEKPAEEENKDENKKEATDKNKLKS